VIGLIGLLSTYLLNWVGRKLMPWYVPEERGVSHARLGEKHPVFHPGKVLQRLGGGLLDASHQYLYEIRNETALVQPKEMPADIRLAWIDENNVAAVCAWKGDQVQHLFQRNLNRGMLGLYALSGERVIGYMWATVYTASNARFCGHYPIELGDGYVKTAEVDPEFRRLGVASWLRYTMIQRIRELGSQVGLQRICGTVLVDNTPVLKLVERQGSVRVQEFLLVRLTPYVFIRWGWRWDAARRARAGRARLSVRFKIPKFLSDPRLQRLLRLRLLKSDRIWQPKGEA
ncbi:MAG TPA: GNAT family N-acetyltransferase, partial [Anaerolineaceae bacterium]|nr:GNAT family N-acetyltransferase [Anaerolineaceae bacterium]